MTVVDVALGAVAVAFVLALVRVLRGPTVADRAVAADVNAKLSRTSFDLQQDTVVNSKVKASKACTTSRRGLRIYIDT